jgi:hypothetical protein
MTSGVWYSVWLQIYNQPTTAGGGVFYAYIKGGHFTEPTLLPNWVDGTDFWKFRAGATDNNPIQRLLTIAGTNSGTNFVGSAATYIDAIYVNVGNADDLTDPTATVEPRTWAGYDVDANGWVDTGSYLGLLHVDYAPWVYSTTLGGTWFYLPEENVLSSGAWLWAPK